MLKVEVVEILTANLPEVDGVPLQLIVPLVYDPLEQFGRPTICGLLGTVVLGVCVRLGAGVLIEGITDVGIGDPLDEPAGERYIWGIERLLIPGPLQLSLAVWVSVLS